MNFLTLVYSLLCFFVEPGIIPRNYENDSLHKIFIAENYNIDFDSSSN